MNCLICSRNLPQQATWRSLFLNDIKEVVCLKCKAEFEPIAGNKCSHCGLPGDEFCRDCQDWERTRFAGLVSEGRALYHYNEAMQNYLHYYKFLQDVVLADVFAAELNQALAGSGTVLVPIPMNAKKLKERTFPQVDRMLEAAKLPFVHLLLKNEEVQSKKSRAERMSSAPLFQWNGVVPPKKIILVDDLYTTGTTMRHAAKVLKEAGTEEIKLFSLIRG